MVHYNLAAFQEPRGVMRILQFIFSICAFATTTNFVAELTFNDAKKSKCTIDYPFRINCEGCDTTIGINVSSDAQFFVATGVLSLMYCVFIIAVYLFIDDFYKSKPELPLADFGLTTILAIFWLSGSAAWSNGVSALKTSTDPTELKPTCQATRDSFSKLNISLIFGFLNFFLWASDLWFLYKETIWFQLSRTSTMGGGGGGIGSGGGLNPSI